MIKKSNSHILTGILTAIGMIFIYSKNLPFTDKFIYILQIIGGLIIMIAIYIAVMSDLKKDEIAESKEEDYAETMVEEVKNDN